MVELPQPAGVQCVVVLIKLGEIVKIERIDVRQPFTIGGRRTGIVQTRASARYPPVPPAPANGLALRYAMRSARSPAGGSPSHFRAPCQRAGINFLSRKIWSMSRDRLMTV